MSRKIRGGTIGRTFILMIALLNQILILFGQNLIPIVNHQIYRGISLVITVLAAIFAWWKNNSFTQEAIEADIYKNILKNQQDGADIGRMSS